MSLPAVPRSLQLPPGQRARPAFREQRRHNLKELLLERKARFVYKEDYRTLSSICGILLQSIPSSRVLNSLLGLRAAKKATPEIVEP
ncbi:cytoskeleton-associated protein 2-like isoform X3 [Tamandua tetradactyla]|uniref:cytoskeleton-associated protein 2-like isoform X3 n=1 Tax=Tamandua tetradactyla TaxID=48850 RepID=UPI004054445B